MLLDVPKRVTHQSFSKRLALLRKERGLSQQTLATAVGVHVNQVRRYEAGRAQPTLDVLRELARSLHVTTDALVFDAGERGPDDEMRMHFEAISQLDAEERRVVKVLLEALLHRHDAKRWASA